MRAIAKIPVVQFYDQLDGAIAETATQKPACKAGCSYCCHIRVVVQPHEVFSIVEYMRAKFAPQQIKRVLDQARANKVRIEPLTVQQHIATNIPCPLLHAGDCSIYSVRPAKCRAYHSLDVKACEVAHIDTTATVAHPYDIPVLVTTGRYIDGFSRSVAQHGMDAGYYELNGVLLSAFESAEAAKRWRNGKRAFPLKYATTE